MGIIQIKRSVWGFTKSRSWLHNQWVGALLAVACGVLALLSIALTAANRYLLAGFLGGGSTTLPCT